jgi:hypothetical protein
MSVWQEIFRSIPHFTCFSNDSLERASVFGAIDSLVEKSMVAGCGIVFSTRRGAIDECWAFDCVSILPGETPASVHWPKPQIFVPPLTGLLLPIVQSVDVANHTRGFAGSNKISKPARTGGRAGFHYQDRHG